MTGGRLLKKNYFIFSLTLLLFLNVISGCNKSNDNTATATISVNSDSERVNTFKDLNLGILYDFTFKLNNANKNWVDIWVESYKDGKQEPHPIAKLSYGVSPKKVEEGNLGFGIINTEDTPLVFLYAPNVTTSPRKINKMHSVGMVSGWNYAIGKVKNKLKLGETYLLGVYRESHGGSIRTYNLQNNKEIKKIINEDSRVFLLKIKIVKK